MASLTARFGLRKPSGSDLVSNNADISDNMDKIDAMLPAGMLTAFVGTVAPTGWLLCDGRAVSRATYAGLFAVIGTRYGIGDNATTFNLPDLRNKVPAGQNLPGEAVSSAAIGSHSHTALVGAVAHNHGNSGAESGQHRHEHTGGGSLTLSDFNNTGHIHSSLNESAHRHSIPAESVIPTQTVNYIVKT